MIPDETHYLVNDRLEQKRGGAIHLEVSHSYSFPVGFWFIADVKEHLNLSPFCIQTNDQ
ncbi:MAG TPA: hypothetical protein V6C65_30075 [Allocoleopsis sp.]